MNRPNPTRSSRSFRRNKKSAEAQEASLQEDPQSSLSQESLSLDPLRDFTGNRFERILAAFFYQIRQNLRGLLVGGIIVFTSILVFTAYQAWLSIREEKSRFYLAKLLAEPTMNFELGSFDIASEKIRAHKKKFRHRSASIRASLYEIFYLQKAEKFLEAGDLSFRLASQITTPELQAYYYFQSGLFREEAKKYDKAKESYTLAAKLIRKKNILKAYSLYGQARVLVALDEKEEANKILKNILSYENLKQPDFFVSILGYMMKLSYKKETEKSTKKEIEKSEE